MKKKQIKDRRINRPQHIRALMQEQINILRKDDELDSIERARAIAYLSNVALTSIRDGDIIERVEKMEKLLKDMENRQ